MKRLLASFFCLIFFACGPQIVQSELNETISKMINFIEQDQLKLMFKECVDLSGINVSIDEIVAESDKNKIKEFKRSLQRAQILKPILSENNTFAQYESVDFKRPLKFIKINNKWLFKNN